MPIRSSIANSLKSFGADRTGGIPKTAAPVIDYIIVAGGGGGGYNGGGGGGGGGLVIGSGYPAGSGITLSFSIGGGGSAASDGGNSTITGPGTPTITAVGGGRGGDGGGGPGYPGGSGGSGGGGGRDAPVPSSPAPLSPNQNTTSGGPGTSGQGNRGGKAGTPPQGAAGGGGGAGGSGGDGISRPGQPHDDNKNGGDGTSIQNIWGINYSYLNPGLSPGGWSNFYMGCGGGNGVQRDASNWSAGVGGSASSIPALYPHTGGDGGANPGGPVNANSATQYTGSGGGGGGINGGGASPAGGSGSGGSVVVRIDEFYSNAISTTGGPLYTYQNGYYIFHFTGSGSITF